MGAKRGLDMYAYRNTGNYAVAVWDLIPNIKDLTLTTSRKEGDASRRASSVEQMVATLFSPSISWAMVNDPTDADLLVLWTAYDAGTLVEFAFADGPIATNGTRYIRYECQIFDMSEDQPLGDVALVNVTVKPTYTTNAQGGRTVV